MSDAAVPERRSSRPWGFVPLLYFLESIPYVVVTTMSVVMYKKLGVGNEQIGLWTSLIAWPWTLKMLWGPMVDVNSTKRKWIIGTQMLMIVAMGFAAYAIGLPNFLAATLICFVAMAMLSATHDIAADGYYLLALGEKDQAFFVGVRSTFYRLGTIFANGFLVYMAGQLETITNATRFITVENHRAFVAEHPAPNPLVGLWYGIAGVWAGLGDAVGNFLKSLYLMAAPVVPDQIPRAWFVALSFGIAVYALAFVLNLFAMPKPAADRLRKPTVFTHLMGEFGQILLMVTGILLFAQQVHLLYKVLECAVTGRWSVFEAEVRPLFNLGAIVGTPFWLEQGIAMAWVSGAWFSTRHLFGKIGMGPAAKSFFAQNKIGWILAFVLFYRFGEIMIGKMSGPFLLDPVEKGGLAVPTATVGTITGMWGVLGLVFGGILGGMVIAKFGIKKCLWPMVLALNVPNLLYVWAAANLPQRVAEAPQYTHQMVQWLIFVDQFGYGFGFSAYMVYLMFIAQGTEFETSHYAIATGLMALGAMISGIVSGYAQGALAAMFPSAGGYLPFFVAVCFCTIPGMVTLLFIPMDRADIRKAPIEID